MLVTKRSKQKKNKKKANEIKKPMVNFPGQKVLKQNQKRQIWLEKSQTGNPEQCSCDLAARWRLYYARITHNWYQKM